MFWILGSLLVVPLNTWGVSMMFGIGLWFLLLWIEFGFRGSLVYLLGICVVGVSGFRISGLLGC